MKLSDAIREGAKHFKQGYGYLYQRDQGVDVVCALGAAYYATFGELPPEDETDDERLYESYPELLQTDMLKQCGIVATSFEAFITNLNDTDELPFNEIADEVERLGY